VSDAPTPRHTVSPHLLIRDKRAEEAVAFYAAAFGAEERFRNYADDGRLLHAHLVIGDSSVLLNDDFPEMRGGKSSPAPEGVVVHLETADADAAWERALAAGAAVRFPIADQFWGARYGQVTDPFGHIWSIGGPLKK
jgi:PhnB protein